MNRINLIRMNLFRNTLNRNHAATQIAVRDFVAWGTKSWDDKSWGKKVKDVLAAYTGTIHALTFSAVLVACSMAVGCSSDRPKPVSSNQTSVTPAPSSVAATPVLAAQADAKPAPKKVVHKKPATVNYTDKTYGVTFEYPRRYAIETGDAAAELLLSNPLPMNFVQPGGVALAAVELPETSYVNTDFSSAFFNVSVHKDLTADQCGEFAVPQPKSLTTTPTGNTDTIAASSAPAAANVQESKTASAATNSTDDAKPAASSSNDKASEQAKPEQAKPEQAKADAAAPDQIKSGQTSTAEVSNESAAPAPDAQGSKLILKDMMPRGAEAVSGEGPRQSDSKYFHVFQNGACYEFALNVTTVASQEGMTKHVDRDRVFSQLEKIMATVQIDVANATSTPAVTAEKTVTAAPAPAQ